ncbi:alpha/beta-hydrolase [Macroventuria anomochaeta]|uniref:Alpha/beta-hydrolase n=1 Tax=Macroventuria anomochaeta TaxID=301207 RepID=A0ACB6S0I8_9PLEO|nr:alpha/beta-hydrolase [Macroventuria anomochaeta]KAF2627027.1 alpha/beta-hydrolase [Macroventuria anomochaeta]
MAETLAADNAWPLWDDQPSEGAFELLTNNGMDNAVVHSVERPWLFHYRPKTNSNGRAILILGGGGYVELMVGREGVQVARWLAGLGFDAFVLVHRFPNAKSAPQAPVDDARRALNVIAAEGYSKKGLGICGLSSGGHLGAALLAEYPQTWTSPQASAAIPKTDFAIIGYGPISTNAKGRTIVLNKAALEPPAKQELYDVVQPDVQISTAPPTFIVYSGNDPVVPVVNAYRLAEGITKAGAAVELHVFADAPHGFALDTTGLPISKWPNLCEAWLEQNGLLKA